MRYASGFAAIFFSFLTLLTAHDAVAAKTSPAEVAKLRSKLFYGESWAVIIGVNKYEKWPQLESAVNDANAVAERLESLGFNIVKLVNADATRDNIVRVLGHDMPMRVHKNDRVFIFFAGHGHTEETFSGRKLGYIVPYDAELYNTTTAISMEELRLFADKIKAKHLLYVMDSCYSGLGLTRSTGIPPQTEDYVKKITGKVARQMITAGQAGEQVAETGGHGVFTQMLLRGLSGSADTHPDGIITASELGAYLKPKVSQASKNLQTPRYGRLPGDDDGEFVFILKEYFKEQLQAMKKKEKIKSKIEEVELEKTLIKEQLELEALRRQMAEESAEKAAVTEPAPSMEKTEPKKEEKKVVVAPPPVTTSRSSTAPPATTTTTTAKTEPQVAKKAPIIQRTTKPQPEIRSERKGGGGMGLLLGGVAVAGLAAAAAGGGGGGGGGDGGTTSQRYNCVETIANRVTHKSSGAVCENAVAGSTWIDLGTGQANMLDWSHSWSVSGGACVRNDMSLTGDSFQEAVEASNGSLTFITRTTWSDVSVTTRCYGSYNDNALTATCDETINLSAWTVIHVKAFDCTK